MKAAKVVVGVIMTLIPMAMLMAKSPPVDPPSVFVGIFVTPDSSPWPFDVTISDGNSVRRFDSVTYISTAVPETATYTYAWRTGQHRVMNQVILRVPAGDTSRYVFYALDSAHMVPRVRPYIGFKQVGVTPSLTWHWDSVAGTLACTLTTAPPGLVDVATWIDDDLSRPPNYVLARWPAISADYLSGYTTYTSTWTSGLSYGNDAGFDWADGQGSISLFETLMAVLPGTGLGGFRGGIINGKRIDTLGTVLACNVRDIAGTLYEPQYAYPQYALPPGAYLVQPLSLPAEYVKLRLPFAADSDRAVIADYYPLRTDSLQPFTFATVGKFPLASCSCYSLQHSPGARTLTAQVVADLPADWWGCFVLPESLDVGRLVAVDTSGDSLTLSLLYDYVTDPFGNCRVVSVRIRNQYAELLLNYTGAGVEQSSANLPTTYALSVVPNPFTSSLNPSISYSLPRSGNISLKLYDITGKLRSVLAQGYQKAGVSDFELRTSDLPRGIYLLRFETEGYRTFRKLVIQ